MPIAEAENERGRSTAKQSDFNVFKLKDDTLQKFAKELEKILEHDDTLSEEEFREEGLLVLSKVLKNYERRLTGEDTNSNEVELLLKNEFDQYISRHKTKLEDLNKDCDRLAATRCHECEIKLAKEFASCVLTEDLKASCDQATKEACKTYPSAVCNFQLRSRYRKHVKEGMERVEENLANRINANMMELKASCQKRKEDCVRFTEMMMKRKINERVWQENEIDECKDDILKAVAENWDSQSSSSIDTAEIVKEYRNVMLNDAKQVLIGFQNKSQGIKNEVAKQTYTFVKGMRRQYEVMMKEKMGDISNDDDEMQQFHEECDKEVRKSLSAKRMNPQSERIALQEWNKELAYAFKECMKVNTEFQKKDTQECSKAEKKCIAYAGRLIAEEFGQAAYETDDLQDKLRKIRRNVFDKFQTECPTCAMSISRTSKENLERYLQNDLTRIASNRNDRNKETLMKEVAEIEQEMKRKCKVMFNEMLRGQSSASDRILLVRNTVKNKLEDLIDQKTKIPIVIRKCREKIEPILEDEHQLLMLNRELQATQRVDAAKALTTRCLNIYRQSMDRSLQQNKSLEDSHRQAQSEVSALLNREDGSLRSAVSNEVMQKTVQEKDEYARKQRMLQEREDENQRRIVSRFKQFMAVKMGDTSCSPRRLQEYEQQALADTENFRKALKTNMRVSTATQLKQEMEKIRQLNGITNTLLEQLCQNQVQEKVKEFIEAAKMNLPALAENPAAFENAKQRQVQRFCQDVTGNKEIIEAYRGKLKNELSGLRIRRREETPGPRVTTIRQIWFIGSLR